MDLTNQPIILTSYVLDPITDLVTFTFKDELSVALGTIIIERSKFYSLSKAIAIFAKEKTLNSVSETGMRMGYDVQGSSAEITFG
jgi:hypothetical protein